MAQELRIDTWCDVHQRVHGQNEAGEPVEHNGRVVDLCKACMDEYARPFLDVVDAYGRRLDAPPAKRRATPKAAAHTLPLAVAPPQCECVVCGHVIAARSIPAHLRKVHHLHAPSQCPVCGQDGVKVGPHVLRAAGHDGLDSLGSALIWARENGDPFGVYAEVMGAAS